MEVITALFNIFLIIFIVSTMLMAGLSTTLAALIGTFRNIGLVVLVLFVNLVLIPLLGWGVAALFRLEIPAYVALVLVACSPGAPFGAKLAMMQRGDIVTGSSLQVLLATIGSVTFPLTANGILQAAHLGAGVALPVGDLIKAVVALQLLPFAIGFALRQWTPEIAAAWQPLMLRVSNLTFLAVFAFSLLGSWRQLIALLGSYTLLAAVVFTVLAMVIGSLVASGSTRTRTTVGLIAPMRNAGPAFAAVALGFANNPALLGAMSGILLMGLVIAAPTAAYLASKRALPSDAPDHPASGDMPSPQITV